MDNEYHEHDDYTHATRIAIMALYTLLRHFSDEMGEELTVSVSRAWNHLQGQ